jgi:hypothetical protein
MFLVQVGIFILLINLKVFSDDFWVDLLIYFPFVLIAVGIEKIFCKSRVKFISYLTTVFLFVGGLAIAYQSGHGYNDNRSFFSDETFSQSNDISVESIQAVLDLGDNNITIRRATDDLVNARFSQFSVKPRISYLVSDGNAKIELSRHSNRLIGGIFRVDTDDPRGWMLSFSERVPLDLECNGEGARINLNMSSTPLRTLKVDAAESRVYVRVGDLLPTVVLHVAGDDSDFRLRIPRSSGLKVSGADLENYLTQLGLKPRENYFTNEGFDTLGNKVIVDLEDDFASSSFSIDYY